MSETFIEIDSLQHLEISRQNLPAYKPAKKLAYNIYSFDVIC